MPIALPEPIAAYFIADKSTATKLAECFTPDAVVRDEGRTHHGSAEIRRWRAEAAAKFTYTCDPLHVERQGERTVVTCRLEGSFPGSPTNLRFFFRLQDDKIASLEVIP